MRDLIIGATKEKAKGINILVHGPPGTGKTELAHVLAAAVNVRLHVVGEVDEDGEEPNRYDRVTAISVKRARPKDKAYKLSDRDGLYLLIQTNGSRLWPLARTVAGGGPQKTVGGTATAIRQY